MTAFATLPDRDKWAAMMAAYNAEMGTALTMKLRQWPLRTLVEMGFTPEDVAAVLREIKRRIRANMPGYTEVSLEFRNAIGTVAKFEEIMEALRKKALKKPARKEGEAAPVAPVATKSEPVDGTEMARKFRAFRERGLK
jgi:hypothetical protein